MKKYSNRRKDMVTKTSSLKNHGVYVFLYREYLIFIPNYLRKAF